MKWNLLFFIMLGLIMPGESLAQCCSAGNPFFYGEQSTMEGKELQIITGYKYSTSNKYFSKAEEVPIDFIDKAYFNYLNLQLIYGLTYRLSVQADLGYFLNKTEVYRNEDWAPGKGYGPGDATIVVRYLAYKNFVRKFSVVPSLGVKLPVGVFDQETGHVKLPITVQPSSGSFKYLMNLYINKTLSSRWDLGFFGSFEYAQLIDSKNFYYKYGNMYLFSVLASYRFSNSFFAGLELRNENRGKSKRENDRVVESSGYHIVYTIPHISYLPDKNWKISLNAEIPSIRYYNGIQLGNSYAVSLRLAYRLNFTKSIQLLPTNYTK